MHYNSFFLLLTGLSYFQVRDIINNASVPSDSGLQNSFSNKSTYLNGAGPLGSHPSVLSIFHHWDKISKEGWLAKNRISFNLLFRISKTVVPWSVSFMKDWLHYSMANGTIVETHASGTGHMVRPQEARELKEADPSLLWQHFQD